MCTLKQYFRLIEIIIFPNIYRILEPIYFTISITFYAYDRNIKIKLNDRNIFENKILIYILNNCSIPTLCYYISN